MRLKRAMVGAAFTSLVVAGGVAAAVPASAASNEYVRTYNNWSDCNANAGFENSFINKRGWYYCAQGAGTKVNLWVRVG
ncbi:hypothetical protein ACIQAC_12175 [Streptomyces sp. NPDC088387]|uniref:hypothetical protein n=1 Tax=Streptomyces sp. NPDC088387 TaxID=3365859 RepID=UPI003817AC00